MNLIKFTSLLLLKNKKLHCLLTLVLFGCLIIQGMSADDPGAYWYNSFLYVFVFFPMLLINYSVVAQPSMNQIIRYRQGHLKLQLSVIQCLFFSLVFALLMFLGALILDSKDNLFSQLSLNSLNGLSVLMMTIEYLAIFNSIKLLLPSSYLATLLMWLMLFFDIILIQKINWLVEWLSVWHNFQIINQLSQWDFAHYIPTIGRILIYIGISAIISVKKENDHVYT